MTHEWKHYTRVGEIEARPWTKREADDYQANNNRNGVSISDADFAHAISSDVVGMVARNPDNHADQWYIAHDYFAKNYTLRASPVARTEGEGILHRDVVLQALRLAAQETSSANFAKRCNEAYADILTLPPRVEPAATEADRRTLVSIANGLTDEGRGTWASWLREIAARLSASPPSVERLTFHEVNAIVWAAKGIHQTPDSQAALEALASRLSAPGAVEGEK